QVGRVFSLGKGRYLTLPDPHPPAFLEKSVSQAERGAHHGNSEYFPDEQEQDPPRFEAVPVQVQNRGITQQKPQLVLWARQTIHKNSVAAKLRSIGWTEQAAKLEHCHTRFTVGICNDCGKQSKFPNRCDQFYCPECQPRLQNDRQKA